MAGSITVERLEAEVDVDIAKALADLQTFKAAVKEAASVDGSVRINTDFDSDALSRSIMGLLGDGGKGGLRSLTDGMEEAGDAVQDLIGHGGGGGGKGFNGLSSAVSGSGMHLSRLGLMVGGILTLLGPAATGINALGGGVIGLTSALAPLSGLAATIPQGIALIGQGAITAVAGLNGLKDALGEVSKAKTFEEQKAALDALNPAMREMVDLVRGPLKQGWEDIQATSQGIFLPGVQDALESAIPLLHQFNPLVRQTALAMADTARDFGDLFGSDKFGKDFQLIGESNVEVLESIGDAVVSITEGLTDLMVAAAPLTEAVGKGFASMSESFSQWAAEGRRNGNLNDFFQETLRVASQVKDIFSQTAQALGGLGTAAAPLGRDILDKFEEMARTSNEWFKDPENMEGVEQFFNDLKPVLADIAHLGSDIFQAFVDLQDAGTFHDIAEGIRAIIPPLTDFIKFLGDTLGIISELVPAMTLFIELSKGPFGDPSEAWRAFLDTDLGHKALEFGAAIGSIGEAAENPLAPLESNRSVVEDLRNTYGNASIGIRMFLAEQERAGVVYGSTSAAAWGYVNALQAVADASLAAYEAAQKEHAALVQAAETADQEVVAAQRSLSRALRDNVVDTRALERAQESAADAAINLAESYHEASEHLEDLRFAQRRAVLSEARAVNSLQDAYDRLADIQKGIGKQTTEITRVTDDFTGKIYEVTRITGDAANAAEDQKNREKELRDALLDIAEAQLDLEVARDSSLDAQLALTEAERKGINQSDLVVAAQKRLRDANDAVKTAVKNQQRAEEERAFAVQQAQQRVADATRRSVEAWQAATDYANGPLHNAMVKYQNDMNNVTRAWQLLNKELDLWIQRVMIAQALGIDKASMPQIDPATGKFVVPPRAAGGYTQSGHWYRVNEKGQEFFQPGTSGRILDANQTGVLLGGGGVGSKDNMSAAQIEAIVEAVVSKMQKPDITQVFNEKVSPTQMGAELSWRLQ